MFKSIIIAALMLLSFSASAQDDPRFAFQNPDQKVATQMYNAAVNNVANGDRDIDWLIALLNKAYAGAHPNEPSDVYLSCVLYQLGGPEKIKDIHPVALMKLVDTDLPKAKATVAAFNEQQSITYAKLSARLPYYGASCDMLVHHGFIVMPGV